MVWLLVMVSELKTPIYLRRANRTICIKTCTSCKPWHTRGKPPRNTCRTFQSRIFSSPAFAAGNPPTSAALKILKDSLDNKFKRGENFCMYRYIIQHCYICRHSDSTVSEKARIEPGTVATLAWAVRRSNHSARSYQPNKKL